MKTIKVNINTTTTPYISASGLDVIKPTAPMWYIKNTGNTVLTINNGEQILPGQSFGVDVTPLLSMLPYMEEKSVQLEFDNHTELKVVYDTDPEADQSLYKNSLVLVQTYISFKKV